MMGAVLSGRSGRSLTRGISTYASELTEEPYGLFIGGFAGGALSHDPAMALLSLVPIVGGVVAAVDAWSICVKH